MKKIPFGEINTIPSRLNTSQPTGVVSQLASFAKNEPHFDGVTLDQMRGNPLYQRMDDIDKIGVVQKTLVENAKAVKSKSKMIRALNDHATKQRIPATTKK